MPYKERYRVEGNFIGTKGEAERLRLQKRADELNELEYKRSMGWVSPEEKRGQEMESEKMDEDMLFRATYQDPSLEAYPNAKTRISEELRNPAQPMTQSESEFRSNPMNVSMIKERARMGMQQSGRERLQGMRESSKKSGKVRESRGAILQYLEGVDPQAGLFVQGEHLRGKPLKDYVSRTLSRSKHSSYVDVNSDPDIQKALTKFDAVQEPGMMTKAANKIGGYFSRFSKPPAPKPPELPNIQDEPDGDLRPGDVQDGYIFNGGDPSDPRNWEKR